MLKYTQKIIHDARVVWFANANQWAQFNEPQGFIFDLYTHGTDIEQGAKLYAGQFSAGISQSLEIVQQMYESLDTIFHDRFPFPDFTRDAGEALTYELKQQKTHHYAYQGLHFTIRYGSPFLHNYIHLPFQHLETKPALNHKSLLLEVFPFRHRFAMRINGKTCLTSDESPQLKRLLYTELTNFIFQKKTHSWMTMLHASAVEKEGHLLVFSSVSGAGKSTMAALLQKHGFRFFADDFIPVCLAQEKAWPFPAALCLKEGSLKALHKEGIKPDINNRNKTGYLHPPARDTVLQPLPLKSMIFIKWEQGVPTTLEPMPTLDALQLFLQESWVVDHLQGAQQFINWFTRLKFYRLHYSNNASGVAAVERMMGGGGK